MHIFSYFLIRIILSELEMLITNFCSILKCAVNICNSIFLKIQNALLYQNFFFLFFTFQGRKKLLGMFRMGWILKLCEVRSEAPPAHG